MLLKVARKSLSNRKTTAILTILSIAVSVFVLVGVEHIRQEAKNSFNKTVSGVDLIVGARSGQLNLLLYSVFRIGNATNNISWQSYQELAKHRSVEWTIPLSLGDSHRGYRVLGTNQDYFHYFKYGQKKSLSFSQGDKFESVYDAVLGAEVAKKLGYQIGQQVVLAHGAGSTSFSNHDDKPFTVVGILMPTGTPVDQTVHVSLEGIEAIHIGWQNGVKILSTKKPSEPIAKHELTPKAITAFMVGLKSKIATFQIQRQVNQYRKEALMAILPGVALSELWQLMRAIERILLLISILVLFASLLGMSTMLLASMRERQRELAVVRAVGAHPSFLFLLIQIEAILLCLAGVVLGLVSLSIALAVFQNTFSEQYGLFISANFYTAKVFALIGIILGATVLLSLIPGINAYRSSLNAGLVVKN